MGQGKGGLKRKMLGIWYDKDGNVKRIDAQGMSLEELGRALIEKRKEREERLVLLNSITQTQKKYYEEEIEGETVPWDSLDSTSIKIIIDELKDLEKEEVK